MTLIQILRWQIKPNIWRFVCFTSSIVGLLCYALSFSFNHLFGKWIWWKILLYIVFSFIICLAVLFAKAGQRSSTLRLEAHLAFLVLVSTSMYSFFYDKVVKGKPDADSLISCAAFAIMSLGLSRQTHCGFEVDLLYFFCGGLIVQLMKIKLWLAVVGGSFSYSLIILRSSVVAPPGRGPLGLQVQDQVVIEINSHSAEINSNSSDFEVGSPQTNTSTGNAHHVIILPEGANIDPAFDATPENRDSGQRVLVNPVGSQSDPPLAQLMACIEALKKENSNVIGMIFTHLVAYLETNDELPQNTDVNLVMDALPVGIINDLRKTAMLMVNAGLKEECLRAYSSWRREFLEECLWALGLQVEEQNLEDVDNAVEKIETWTKALKVAQTILFPNERRICEWVFQGFFPLVDTAFTEVCRELTFRLLSFAYNLAIWSCFSNTLSSMIPKLFYALYELMRDFELFSGKDSLLQEVGRVPNIWRAHMETEYLSYGEKAQANILEGGLHPSTMKVLKYFRHFLPKKFAEVAAKEFSLSDHIGKMTDLLDSSLEAESKNYKNPTLGYVFIMNNRRFIEAQAKLRQLETTIGEDWLPKNTTELQENFELYQSSWNKILDFLKLEINESEPDVAAELMKEKLHSFNEHFDEICNVQSEWFVFDDQQREKLIKSIENILLPAYGNFVGRFQDFLGKQAYEYIQYGMFSLQDKVQNLFLVKE